MNLHPPTPPDSVTHFNGLTPAEAERLALLAEECGEIVQVIGKILRHGYESSHPDDATDTTNRTLLEKEIGDFECVLEMMSAAKDVKIYYIGYCMKTKQRKIGQYLHHQ